MWLKTPSKLKQQKLYKKSLKASRRLKRNSSYYQDSMYNNLNNQNSFMDTRNYPSQDYRRLSRSNSRFNSMNDINQMSFINNANDFYPRQDSFINPVRMSMNMSQGPYYNKEAMYNDMINGSSDQLNGLFLENSLSLSDEEYYEYQAKRTEILRMKFVIEKLAFLVRYLQYSSPFLCTALMLYIYKKKAREWLVLFKCAYQLITYQLKDPYVIVTSPKKKKINY